MINVIGFGYIVGLPTALMMDSLGVEAIGADDNKEVVSWPKAYLSWNIAVKCFWLQSYKAKPVAVQKTQNWLNLKYFKNWFPTFIWLLRNTILAARSCVKREKKRLLQSPPDKKFIKK